MKFSDGFWLMRPGVTALYAKEAYNIAADAHSVVVTAPTKIIETRGDTLNCPTLTVTLTSPLPGIIGVRIAHHVDRMARPSFALTGEPGSQGDVRLTDEAASLTSGGLTARVAKGVPWSLTFEATGQVVARGGQKSIAYIALEPGAAVDGQSADEIHQVAGWIRQPTYVVAQLDLGIGELVYGFGERFGPLVKNGQTIDIWNSDGGTSSEQAYKNVPFYWTNRGYGVFVNHTGHVSFEIGSESVERVQFSVPGESIEYFVIYGPTPREVLERYTQLTGRASNPPAWSYGVWLSTSFTTQYDEPTVRRFVEEMAQRQLPLSVFHFDCFWMREFEWSNFTWDPRGFPDPAGMLAWLHAKGLRACVWINPYIAQRSPLFAEAEAAGYLVKRRGGAVWQWDMWQAGMGLVDFTNPAATLWFQGKLGTLLQGGVDAFKTDFGERIPLDVEWFDGSNPEGMHNYYALLYNQAVFDVLETERGRGEAVVFARAATVGSQRLPVHWGGDSSATFESMAESLRGGLSLACSGFSFWSHDIGGFEETPDPAVFKRWIPFGLLSSHSRFHGSASYRVPWEFDEEAVDLVRKFTRLKLRLMPYIYAAGVEASVVGTPVLRPLQLEYPDDPSVAYLDRQYLLGPDLLVAPVFSADGSVDFYLPAGVWTNYETGDRVEGPTWRREHHNFDSLPLFVREGAVLPVGARDDVPDYDYLNGLTLEVYPSSVSGVRTVRVTTPHGQSSDFVVERSDDAVKVTSTSPAPWRMRVIGGDTVSSLNGEARLSVPRLRP